MAPRDARLFSTQMMAVAALGEQRTIDLLQRTQADGGGNGFYNFAVSGEQRYRMWMELAGNARDIDRSGDRPGTRSSAFGGQIGLDAEVRDGGRIGIAGGYDRTSLHDDLGSRGTGDVARIGFYASQTVGRIGLSAIVGYAHAWQESRRETGIGRAVARYGIGTVTVGAQASAALAIAGTTVTPALGVVASRFGADLAEDGSVPAAFAVGGRFGDRTYVSPFANIGLSRVIDDGRGTSLVPDVSFGYRRSEAAAGPEVRLVAADGTAFAGNRANLSRDTLSAGAGLTLHRGGWTGYVRYRGQFADRWTDNSGTLGIRLAF